MRISDWSSDVCSSDLGNQQIIANKQARLHGFRGDVEGRDNKTAQDENEEAKLHEEKQEIPCFRFFTHKFAFARAIGHGASLCVGSSEERRVGKEWVSTCRSRVAPYH